MSPARATAARMTPEEELIAVRKQKLARLRALGIDPYPHAFKRTHAVGEILAGFEGLRETTVRTAGRIMSVRGMGKTAFAHVQDGSGRIQVYLKRDALGERDWEIWNLLDLGDVVGVEGKPFVTKTGERSIHVASFRLLAKAIRPLPVAKEKEGVVYEGGLADKETRYRKRHLDLIVNPAVREVFATRARIVAALRHFLDARGFLEVETPALQPLYGGASARPFVTHLNALNMRMYLRISDELYLKRLIIGGFDRVYEIAKDFRNEGMDRNHNPEFSLLEFYWTYADYNDGMDLVEALVRTVAQEAVGTLRCRFEGCEIDLARPFARASVSDLSLKHLGVDCLALDAAGLRDLCRDHRIPVAEKATVGQLLDAAVGKGIEPHLVQPTFMVDYPVEMSPLAKRHRGGNPRLVERFELFIGGTEFANAFTELNDPIDQRARFEMQAAFRDAGDEEAQVLDEDFLEAMEQGMPPTAGVGIGVDRLVMLLTGQPSIRDVLLFPAMRPQA